MIVLGLDTSAGACSAAVLGDDGRVRARQRRILARGHAEVLMPMLQEVLAEAALDFTALDLLAVTTGPGTFTGIRIGLAAARGLALASGLPLLGVTSLDAVAAAVPAEARAGRFLLVAIDSRRDDLFVQAYGTDDEPLGPAQAVAATHLTTVAPPGDILVAGDAAERAAAILLASGRAAALAGDCGPPDAAEVAQLARRRWRPDRPVPLPLPTYLRAPDVTLPAAAGPAPGGRWP
ncbi:MAG: tRNA (adenosine(37)-N6)-threonylcarbamoyltransferase complex dimerization subunit type 1 TsaB [Alphaproteobacteria bacterium]|nr:tRNA (adenosine(37)-N6)-threonylcarbamoyltransferase complex dimerization subunit type 1 TsaB [Alphaproteobacteria bacterium]